MSSTTNSIITVTVTVDQAEAIRQGLAYREHEPVDLDLALLSPEERSEIATLTSRGLDRPLYSYAAHYNSSYPACLPTQEGVQAMLQVALAKKSELAARKAKEDAAALQRALELAAQDLAAPLDKWIDLRHGDYRANYPHNPCDASASYYDYPGIRERYAEATRDATRRNAQAKIEQEARESAEAARVAEGGRKLRAWALYHGSELLLARIAGDWDWIALAHEEFVAAHLPAGYTLSAHQGETRTSPTLAEIQAYRAGQALCTAQPEIYAEPQLLYCEEESEDDDENPARHCTVVAIDIVCPDGYQRTVELIIN